MQDPDYVEYQELFYDIVNWGDDDKVKIKRFLELEKIYRDIKKIKTVRDYLEHPGLYKAYPFIANIGIEKEEMRSEKNGKYNVLDNVITLNKDLFSEYRERSLKETLLHELQHVIQHYERFAGGANIDTWKEVDIRENQQKNEKAMKEKKEAFGGGTDEFKDLVRKLNKLQLDEDFM